MQIRIGHSELGLRLPLLNNNDMTFAHEAFELELKHKQRNEDFPEAEIVRLYRGIEPTERYDPKDPKIAELIKYPVRQCQTEVHFRFGVEDLVHANELLNHEVYGGLSREIVDHLQHNRMDVVMLSPYDSPMRTWRDATHTVSLWDLHDLMGYRKGALSYQSLMDKRRRPQRTSPHWRPKPFFAGLAGQRPGYGPDVPEAILVGRWPNEGYEPNETEMKIFNDGRTQGQHTLNRRGRGYIVVIPLGVLDMFLLSFLEYMLDQDQEQVVMVNGSPVTATLRVPSLYNRWRAELCPHGYRDLTQPQPTPPTETESDGFAPAKPTEDSPVVTAEEPDATDEVSAEEPDESPNLDNDLLPDSEPDEAPHSSENGTSETPTTEEEPAQTAAN